MTDEARRPSVNVVVIIRQDLSRCVPDQDGPSSSNLCFIITCLVFFTCLPPLQASGSAGFVGCIRDLTLNEAPAGSPAHSLGTVPCFQDPLQPGVYFSGQGGHAVTGAYIILLLLLLDVT